MKNIKEIKNERVNIRHSLEIEKNNFYNSIDKMIEIVSKRLEELYIQAKLYENAEENAENNKILNSINYEIDNMQENYSILSTLNLKKLEEII